MFTFKKLNQREGKNNKKIETNKMYFKPTKRKYDTEVKTGCGTCSTGCVINVTIG